MGSHAPALAARRQRRLADQRDAARESPALRDRHLAVVRCVVAGRWAALREMELDRFAADDAFRRYAARQHIAHYLLQRLIGAHREAAFPAAWIEGLRSVLMRGRERGLRLPAALREAVSALTAAGVDCLVLKGRPFGQRYYGSADVRHVGDIDLLVRVSEVERALSVLWGLGYRCKPRRVQITDRGVTLRRHLLRTEHALSLVRDDVPIDLHWQLRTAPAYRLNDAALWAEAQRVSCEDTTYAVPSDEYALVLLLLSIAHDIARGHARLKHIVDVHQLLHHPGANFDWPGFLARREAENIHGICVSVLAIVLDVLDCRDELPSLDQALQPQRAPHRARVPSDSIALVHGLDRSVANALWFAGIYPVIWQRDARWLLDRNLPHLGRAYVSLYRVLRFGLRWIGYSIARLWRRPA